MTPPTLTDAEARAVAEWYLDDDWPAVPPAWYRGADTAEDMARYILARTEPPTPPADWPGRERLPGEGA